MLYFIRKKYLPLRFVRPVLDVIWAKNLLPTILLGRSGFFFHEVLGSFTREMFLNLMIIFFIFYVKTMKSLPLKFAGLVLDPLHGDKCK